MKYKILKETVVHDDYFKIVKAHITHDCYDGSNQEVVRYAFERGDSVAVLLFDKNAQEFLLTEQFRYPTCKHQKGWIVEIVAGSIDPNETPEVCAEREVLEEMGYRVTQLQLIHTFYTSPGGSTERMYLYYGEVSDEDKIALGGGVNDEHEDIRIVRIAKSNVVETLPHLEDAKTILALQWFLINMQ